MIARYQFLNGQWLYHRQRIRECESLVMCAWHRLQLQAVQTEMDALAESIPLQLVIDSL